MSRFTTISLGLLAALGTIGVAHADGVVMTRAQLGDSAATIEANIAQSRAQNPTVFQAARGIDQYRPAGYKRTRSQNPAAAGVRYRRLGKGAVWALVELAALDAPTEGLSARDLTAWRVSLVDAIGVAREPKTTPVLRVAMLHGEMPVAIAAAIGLGNVGDVQTLLGHAVAGDPLLVPAVRGLGAARDVRATTRLGELLDRSSDAQLSTAIVEALGEAGSSWAWATGSVGSKEKGEQVRALATAALTRRYARDAQQDEPIALAIHRVDARVTLRR